MEKFSTYKPAIVIPAHRRKKSLVRLLNSINEATFNPDDVPLILSIDGGSSSEVVKIARNFKFQHGVVEVIEHKQNLGVYNHILACADLSQKYGSVLVLEDDLVVGPAFYEYASKALSFYSSEEYISGISLYAQKFNETAQLPFEPMESSWPVYFMQLGCSWGQAWTQTQWQNFRHWHENGDTVPSLTNVEIPKNIQEWPETSWKKHYNNYLISQDKYVVYPYKSFSTNTSEGEGVHMKYVSNTFHVPLNMSERLGNDFSFPVFNNESIVYDSFMENKSKWIEKWSGIDFKETAIDLYGSKPLAHLRKKAYAITSKSGKNPIRSFPLSFRPLELNLKFEIESEEDSFLHLFRTEGLIEKKEINKSHYFQMADYFSYFPIQSRRFADIFFSEIFKSLLKRVKLIFKDR